MPIEKKCQICKDKFSVSPSRKKQKCCGMPCRNEYLATLPPAFLGRHHSTETKERLSRIFKGINRGTNGFKKGHVPWNTGKSLPKGESAFNWKGGRVFDGRYFRVFKPDHPAATLKGYVYEHRLVLEKKLGRYLKPGEISHHINENRADNRPENLSLFKSKSEHMEHHHPKGRKIGRK